LKTTETPEELLERSGLLLFSTGLPTCLLIQQETAKRAAAAAAGD
jgi:hypothetical protein